MRLLCDPLIYIYTVSPWRLLPPSRFQSPDSWRKAHGSLSIGYRPRGTARCSGNAVCLQELDHLLKGLCRRVVRVDVVPRIGSEVGLRALAGSGKVRRYGRGGLIGRVRAIAAAVEVVILSVDDVHGARVRSRRGVRGAQGEYFAECVGLLVGDLDGEYCFAVNNDGSSGWFERCDGAYSLGRSPGIDRSRTGWPGE